MRKVLILGVAAVQLDAIKELKDMGYETHACAMAKDGPGVEMADYFVKINILDKEKIINYILDKEISLVYSVGSDLAMPVASYISEQLKMPYFVSEKTALICNNKNLMRESLGNDFKGNLKYQVFRDSEENIELSLPFILKPADSQGQRGVKLIESLEEFKESFKIAKSYSRSGLVILEQYITGPEISVNGYMVDGQLKFLISSDRDTWPEYTGLIRKHIVPSSNLSNESNKGLKEIIESACHKLEIYNGPVYVQMKLEKEEPYIIEITPRLDGCHMWHVLKYYTGVNLLKLTLNHLLNNDVSKLENLYKEFNDEYVLEFACQAPNTKANFTEYEKFFNESLVSYKYYSDDQLIRAVNGKYDKVGYFINKK